MSADSDMVELRPCPFPGCGRQPIHGFQGGEDAGYGYVECPNQGGVDEDSDGGHFCGVHADDEDAAIRIWNTRAALDASGIGELVAENRELRNIIASLGYCTPDASLEFMRLIPGEVALSRARATQETNSE